MLDYAGRNGCTCYHANCTCMTGLHPMSAVGSELRVHRCDALQVVDASVAGRHLDQTPTRRKS